MKPEFIVRTLLFFALTILLIASAFGQETTATVYGTVSDANQAALGGAKITVTNVETGFQRTSVSDKGGNYTLPLLPVGTYDLTVEASGFQRYLQKGITLTLNEEVRLNAKLAVGAISETVEVNSEAGLINLEQGSVGQVIGRRGIEDLPLNGRNFLQLASLQAGVTPNVTTITEFTAGHSGQTNFSVNGLRAQSNNFLLDGADNNDGFIGTAGGVPSPDALQEFRILTNAYSAEYGRGGGAVVNIVTRGGTNQFHSSIYDYLRNDIFDARNFFSADVPKLRQNQFGGTFGGPIRQNKTFFFGSYEGLRRVQGVVASSVVPSSLERQGNFGTNARIRDPLLTGLCRAGNNTTDRAACFPNGQIPLNRFSSITNRILALIPGPNRGGSSLVSVGDGTTDSNQFLVRVDHTLTSKDSLSVRYFFEDGKTLKPFTTPPPINVPGFPFRDDFRFQNLAVSDTHVFLPNLIYEFRFGYAYTRTNFNQAAYNIDPTTLGFTYPIIGDANIPLIGITGLTTFGTSFETNGERKDNIYQFKNHLTYVRGRHSINTGVDIFRNFFNLREDNNNAGNFTFRGGVTNNAIADFLLGQPTGFTQASPGAPAFFRSTYIQPYVQDDFRVNKRLTLNYGLRYELNLPVSEKENRLVAFRPGEQSQIVPTAPRGLLFQGDPGLDQIIRTDKNNFAPRVGFALDVFGDGKTSLRGGYGIYYDILLGTLYGNFVVSTPYTATVSGTTPRNFTDPFTGASPFRNGIPTGLFPNLLTLNVLDPDYESPYNQQWNLSLQRELFRNFIVEAAYVGTKGTHLPGTRVLNTGVFTPTATPQNVDSRRPFGPAFGQILNYQSTFYSNYNSLQLTANKRFSKGYSLLAAYTFSKAIDNGSYPTGRRAIRVGTIAQDQNNLNGEKGLSSFDTRHRFVVSYLYELPFFRSQEGVAGKIFGGWQFNGITTFSTGKPIVIQDSSDPNRDGVASDRPDVLFNPNLPRSQRTVARYWDTSAFVRIPGGTNRFGSAARNIVIGPGYNNTDMSLFKNFAIKERANIQLRWEVFNVFNTPNFDNPGGGAPSNDIASPIFGSLQSTLPNSERIMQFALRISF